MAAKTVWVFTCIHHIASTQAMICGNWEDEETCVKNNDGGCGCVWNTEEVRKCIKGKKCEEGMVGITSVVEPEPEPAPAPAPEPEPVSAEQYYNLSNPSSPAQELKLPCKACRRGLFPDEENQKAACEKAGGKVALCDCLTVFCTVNVPADTLGIPDVKSDAKTSTDAPLLGSEVPTTSTTSVADGSASVAVAVPASVAFTAQAKLMLVYVLVTGARAIGAI